MRSNCEFILDNLRDEDLKELEVVWQDNWREKVLASLDKTEVLFAFGNDEFGDKVPIAMGGFYELFEKNSKIACVWLLSTKFVYKNKMALMKVLKHQISTAGKKYDVMYNYIYKSNKQAKHWLKKLGFKFDNPKPKELNVMPGFEFFYKVKNRKEL